MNLLNDGMRTPHTVMCKGGGKKVIGCYTSSIKGSISDIMNVLISETKEKIVGFDYKKLTKNLIISFPTEDDCKEFYLNNILVNNEKIVFYKTDDSESNILNISIREGKNINIMDILKGVEEKLSKLGCIHDIVAFNIVGSECYSTRNINILFTPDEGKTNQIPIKLIINTKSIDLIISKLNDYNPNLRKEFKFTRTDPTNPGAADIKKRKISFPKTKEVNFGKNPVPIVNKVLGKENANNNNAELKNNKTETNNYSKLSNNSAVVNYINLKIIVPPADLAALNDLTEDSAKNDIMHKNIPNPHKHSIESPEISEKVDKGYPKLNDNLKKHNNTINSKSNSMENEMEENRDRKDEENVSISSKNHGMDIDFNDDISISQKETIEIDESTLPVDNESKEVIH
ncbi:hypothetical protein AYI70_g4199 [Smittium culicis]|uniref:Uncharacterized protein n=1 Tax=Smittium culicis TaxID=133412 RepID=A0A1R1Y0A8_9FUNG|nr:hypothetical protein AYI70_g4199 [Smittium culicis]